MVGASGVVVDGVEYDVEFIAGTCFQLFTQCNEVSDFFFDDDVSAFLATQALLNQVLLDGPEGQFDSLPELTEGCFTSLSATECRIVTPYGFESDPFRVIVEAGIALNRRPANGEDLPLFQTIDATFNTANSGSYTFARWTPSRQVPVQTPLGAVIATALVVAAGVHALRRGVGIGEGA